MAGKKYQAESKTVQKMTRNGLVEEDLHTGKTRRAVTHETEGVRIGERPMDTYSDAGSSRGIRDADRSLRLDRRGMQTAGTAQESGHMDDRGHKKYKRNSGREESSLQEAPSLMEKDRGTGTGPGASAETADLEDMYANGLREDSRSSFRTERMARSSDEDGYALDGEKESGPESDHVSKAAKSQRLHQKKMAQYRQESSHAAQLKNSTDRFGYMEEESGRRMEKGSVSATDSGSDGSAKRTDEGLSQEGRRTGKSVRNMQIHSRSTDPARQEPLSARSLQDGERKTKSPDYTQEDNPRRSRLRDTSSDLDGLDGLKEEIEEKQKKGRLYHEQRRSGSTPRLSFEDTGGMVKGKGAGFSRRAGKAAGDALSGMAGAAAGTAGMAVHTKISKAEAEEDNAGTQAAHDAELTMEKSARSLASRKRRTSHRRSAATRRMGDGTGRLQFGPEEGTKGRRAAKTETDKKTAVRKFLQKQRQRRMYAAAKKEEKAVETVIRTQQSFAAKAAAVVREAFVRHTNVFLVIGIGGLLFLLISTSITSCGALIQGAGSSFVSTTYPSTDEDIYAVENRYRELEAGLNAQINRMRQDHPDYDEFRYQIDEISHNPYHLISYFTTKYGQFTYDQVKDELEEIFREQYSLTTSGERNVTITETRTVQPGESLGQAVTSGYCSCAICCGPWAGGRTASGAYPTSNHTIAVDAYDPFVPMGTHVVMNGIEYVVEDTGAFARFGVQFDVYYDDHQTALTHGHQTWDAYLASDNPGGALEVTTTRTVDRMSVILTNHDLDEVLQNRLTEEEKVRYNLYNLTFGNRNYLFDLNNLPAYGRGSSDYTIPPEALTDERFARMIAEAEKYLGVPYVWGGYSPSGFDCSGFVCWVVNHCGNGWDIGRTTAEGIRQICHYVSPEEARPGDIIFFEHTYDTAGASHVGIYVGNNMMIHCGEPVQYTSINGYWQDHFMQFGRLS